jgi:hypothetical protein
MKRLTVQCPSCQEIMITIDKEEFNLFDYQIREVVNGNLHITSAFTCSCGENVIATENDITDI